MVNFKNLDTTQSYKQLQILPIPTIQSMLNPSRITQCDLPLGDNLRFNWAACPVQETILATLQDLADEQEVSEKFRMVYEGQIMNKGENRMVLHHLTRGQLGKAIIDNGKNIKDFYAQELQKVIEFSTKVHNGTILGSSGKKFETVVQIGIGGSDLGPRALYLALEKWARQNSTQHLTARFISNVDPDDGNAVIDSLNLHTSLFILVSKSGTTQETLANEMLVRKRLESAGLKAAQHIVAVTSETSPLAKNPNFVQSFYIDDYIGGRYSSTSPVGGLLLSLAFGYVTFTELLQGANQLDQMAREKEIIKNPTLLDALIGVYQRNILKMGATVVLPYSEALSRFPAHLQQLDMESNGKRVNIFSEPLSYSTGPLVFGEPGTNGQHSFYQLLHQGTDVHPLQFIGFSEGQTKADIKIEGSTSRQKLNANLIAQIVAFGRGKSDANGNRHFPGERPSTLIYGKVLNPKTLGSLLAHFENKVMFQGFLWNINSFDQEGVQLGKVLAKNVLEGSPNDPILQAYSRLLV